MSVYDICMPWAVIERHPLNYCQTKAALVIRLASAAHYRDRRLKPLKLCYFSFVYLCSIPRGLYS